MPRRGGAGAASASPAPEPRFAPNGYRLPDPIREGEILTDVAQKQWRLGRSIGVGGFGEIYLASDDIRKPAGPDSQYVIKIEPHRNGPLFVEMNFYLRVAKPSMIENWMKERRMKQLGMPSYWGFGSHVYRGEKYRFLVLTRFGSDLHKLFAKHSRRFHPRTAFSIGIQILETLEYIHAHGYSHSDIKDSNLLLGLGASRSGQIYLLDYGLASKYVNQRGHHKEYRQDLRKAHDGTIEYTSRDAHIGAHSRRGDLEILGYNMLQWVCSRLPWEDDLSNPETVAEQKRECMNNIPYFLRLCFPNDEPPAVLAWYMKYVASLGFDTKPDYALCKQMLKEEIQKLGFKYNGQIIFDSAPPRPRPTKSKKRKAYDEPENIGKPPPKRVARGSARQPCAQQNTNRMTRGSQPLQPVLRSHKEFSWEKVLLSDPEKQFRARAEKIKKRKLKRSRLCSANTAVEEVSSLNHTCGIIKDSTLSPSSALQLAIDAESLQNPTPAMLEQLERMRSKKGNVSPACSTRGKSKSDSSRCSSPVDNPNMLTPAMENVIRRKDRNLLNFHYYDSLEDSDGDSYSVASSGSEFIPHSPITIPRHLSIRAGLRKRPVVRRISSSSDCCDKYLTTDLVSNGKSKRPTSQLPCHNSKEVARRRPNTMALNLPSRKKSSAISKKYIRGLRNLRKTTRKGG